MQPALRSYLVAAVFLVAALWGRPASALWQRFTTAQGLADNEVYALLEDRDENLWFATGAGISRYDGVNWGTFTPADGLAAGQVFCMIQDGPGNLWFGTEAGVSRFDGATWTTFDESNGLAENHVFSMMEDRQGNLWFGTAAGANRFDGTTWTTFQAGPGGPHAVSAIVEDRSGLIWLGTEAGLRRLDGAVFWPTESVTSILEDRSGRIWVGTLGAGVHVLDGMSWRTLTTVDGLARNNVYDIAEDPSGMLWFATGDITAGADGGRVCRFDGRVFRTFANPGGYVVTSVQVDRSGSLWFGTVGGAWGASRYDRSDWTTYTTADGLAWNKVLSMLEDRSGDLWFGCEFVGVSRFDGVSWRTYTPDSGLASDLAWSMLQDRQDNIWFSYWIYGRGVTRFDGTSTWKTFTTNDGLVSDTVLSLLEDRNGGLWFGTPDGVSRFDGALWDTITVADGLAGNTVYAMVEDRAGNIWFGTESEGVSRFGGADGWRTFTEAEGLCDDTILSMLEDPSGKLWFGHGAVCRYDPTTESWTSFGLRDGLAGDVGSMAKDRWGNLWFATFQGVSRYDGSTWRTLTEDDGLAGNQVYSILEDRNGVMWFGTERGLSRYEPDRTPPKTLFLSSPSPLSPSRNQGASFAAAYGETQGVQFSHRFDSATWSDWSSVPAWTGSDIPDGPHLLQVRARDFWGNTDSTAAAVEFEVDATPPAPVISAPTFGSPVRGMTSIRGATADNRFASYRVETRPSGTITWDNASILAISSSPVEHGPLTVWDTTVVPDGVYDLRVSVVDYLGLVGTAQVTVLVDNRFPFADQTAPAVVSAAAGGDLYTNNAELHLYFPPRAFRDDALVSISTVGGASDSLASGAAQASPAYVLAWSAPLSKPATLEFSTLGSVSGPLAVYYSSNGIDWSRLGGTSGDGRLSLAIRSPGEYALFTDAGPVPEGAATLSELSFTPRVFSPVGSFAQDYLAIGFTLGRSSSVTVRIYNRAGRLIREVVSGQTMPPGSSLVRWDGRDRAGVPVADGLYLVSVQAQGLTQRKTIAVVR